MKLIELMQKIIISLIITFSIIFFLMIISDIWDLIEFYIIIKIALTSISSLFFLFLSYLCIKILKNDNTHNR